ncbi:HipA domain-containing protein [uncultured Bifidobacterium sp.]|uniref:HipA domain-containing protein n=1 Tax=uncultured Bifidobacterium sp. TaxID=165187 RepID=UPI00260AAD14|nr:HipA domain-containing protein [uncultured Bifidobacterium sp.]
MTDSDDSILHDFSDQTLKVSMYDGAAEKRTMDYHGHRYMVKFGYHLDSSKLDSSRTSYANIPVNEFIGSKVFAAAGIPTQHVLLGTYRGQSVVACRDFMEGLDPSWRLVHFKQLEIGMPGESGRSKARPDWEFVRHVLADSPDLAPIRQAAWDRFRRMICVDALIGNYDRHSNNWGYIADGGANIVGLAPVYDCGSSLMPHLSADEMRARLDDPALMRQANIDSPAMAMNVRGKRRKYGYFLVSDAARDIRAALPGLWDSLRDEDIDQVIAGTPGIDGLHRDFYRATLHTRKEYILRPALDLALQEMRDARPDIALAPRTLPAPDTGVQFPSTDTGMPPILPGMHDSPVAGHGPGPSM